MRADVEVVRESLAKAVANLAYAMCFVRHTKMQPPCDDCRREADDAVRGIHLGAMAASSIRADKRQDAIKKNIKRTARKRRRTW